jgi:hypothetical protein
VQDAQGVGEERAGDRRGDVLERQVGGGEGHAQAAAHQHHHHQRGGGGFGEVFGVARKRHAGLADDALVHRRGDHAGKLARLAAGDGPVEHVEHVAAVGGVEPPRHRRHRQRHVEHLEAAGRGRGAGRVVEDRDIRRHRVDALGDQLAVTDDDQPRRPVTLRQGRTELGPDAGRLTAGDGEDHGVGNG